MAERRMVTNKIIDSDLFLDMPATTQLLYFHLLLKADDEGFIASPKSIMRNIGVKDDDLRLLIAKQFLIIFNSGVVVIRHWKIHNYIQSDRFHPTVHEAEKKNLLEDTSKAYLIDVSKMDTKCIQHVSKMDTEVRLDKVREGKLREDKSKTPNGVVKGEIVSDFERFWSLYPKKMAKPEALKAWAKIKPLEVPLILEVLPIAKRSKDWVKEGGQFIPYPATWLNRRQWEDDYQSINFKDLSPSQKYELALESIRQQEQQNEY